MQVSVGKVENLEDAIASLHSVYEALESECGLKFEQVKNKTAEARAEVENSERMLDEARQLELDKQNELNEANSILDAREQELSRAVASLSTCELGGSYSEDGIFIPPDCSSEESEVSEAESAVNEAENKVSEKEVELANAKDSRMQLENRSSLAKKCLNIATQLENTVKIECDTRLKGISAHIETGISRLNQAQDALQQYHAIYPQAEEVYSWLKWSPENDSPLGPADLNSRLNLSAEQQQYFLEYLTERDSAFRAKIASYRSEFRSLNGPAEEYLLQLKIRRNMSGLFAEKIVEYGLAPLGNNIRQQAKTTFNDGKFTKTDFIIEDLKVPIILGRGEKMGAQKGGSIAIEVKCGKSSYIYAQKDHMMFQAGGHQNASASVTICSRDIKDLTPEQEEELRSSLRVSGSPLIGMLPSKEEIDKTVWDAVTDYNKETSLEN